MRARNIHRRRGAVLDSMESDIDLVCETYSESRASLTFNFLLMSEILEAIPDDALLKAFNAVDREMKRLEDTGELAIEGGTAW